MFKDTSTQCRCSISDSAVIPKPGVHTGDRGRKWHGPNRSERNLCVERRRAAKMHQSQAVVQKIASALFVLSNLLVLAQAMDVNGSSLDRDLREHGPVPVTEAPVRILATAPPQITTVGLPPAPTTLPGPPVPTAPPTTSPHTKPPTVSPKHPLALPTSVTHSPTSPSTASPSLLTSTQPQLSGTKEQDASLAPITVHAPGVPTTSHHPSRPSPPPPPPSTPPSSPPSPPSPSPRLHPVSSASPVPAPSHPPQRVSKPTVAPSNPTQLPTGTWTFQEFNIFRLSAVFTGNIS